jgi:hypothetical protein
MLEQEIEERALGLLEAGVGPGLEVAQVREDALLKLLHVDDGPAEGLEPEDEGANWRVAQRRERGGAMSVVERVGREVNEKGRTDVGARDVVEARPEDAADALAVRERKPVDALARGAHG